MPRCEPGPYPPSLRGRSPLGLALACLGAISCLVAPSASAEEKLVDGIAAQVGSDIVLVSEVMQMVGPVEEEVRAQGGTDLDIARLRAEGLERIIEWRLIEQVVEQSELYASDDEIDAAIRGIADQNQISVEELRESVTSHGLPYEDYRDRIKSELERRKAVGMMVGSRVEVDEEEVRALYAERFSQQPEGGMTIRLRQILVTYGEDVGRSRRDACLEVEAAQARVAGGEGFASVASEISVIAPERGGDIGWVHWDTAAGWMKEVVAELEPGETSDVLVLPFACGMLQLVERREYQPVAFEQARPVLEQEIYERHMNDAVDEWVDTLREHTFIERKGYFADAASFSKPPEARDSQLP